MGHSPSKTEKSDTTRDLESNWGHDISDWGDWPNNDDQYSVNDVSGGGGCGHGHSQSGGGGCGHGHSQSGGGGCGHADSRHNSYMAHLESHIMPHSHGGGADCKAKPMRSELDKVPKDRAKHDEWKNFCTGANCRAHRPPSEKAICPDGSGGFRKGQCKTDDTKTNYDADGKYNWECIERNLVDTGDAESGSSFADLRQEYQQARQSIQPAQQEPKPINVMAAPVIRADAGATGSPASLDPFKALDKAQEPEKECKTWLKPDKCNVQRHCQYHYLKKDEPKCLPKGEQIKELEGFEEWEARVRETFAVGGRKGESGDVPRILSSGTQVVEGPDSCGSGQGTCPDSHPHDCGADNDKYWAHGVNRCVRKEEECEWDKKQFLRTYGEKAEGVSHDPYRKRCVCPKCDEEECGCMCPVCKTDPCTCTCGKRDCENCGKRYHEKCAPGDCEPPLRCKRKGRHKGECWFGQKHESTMLRHER